MQNAECLVLLNTSLSLKCLLLKRHKITFTVSTTVVQHVHVHVLPRRTGDFEKNDSVYDEVGHLYLFQPMLCCMTKSCNSALHLDCEAEVLASKGNYH